MRLSNAKKNIYSEEGKHDGLLYKVRSGIQSVFKEFQGNTGDTNERRETLFRLDYLAKTKGFGLLTGGAGRGKTTIIRTWASGLNPSLYKVIYTCFLSSTFP